MTQVLVADSSAVVRSVLKEIILHSTRLQWIGEAASYHELKNKMASRKPEIIITDKALFDAERSSAISDYCHTTEIPSVVYYTPGEKVSCFSNKIKFMEMPEFINFTTQKILEYTNLLEQMILDIKCSVLFENHPSSIISSIKPDGSFVPVLKDLPKEVTTRSYKAVLVGVSTGGPSALLEFLKGIGQNFPLPIFITQHIDSFFDKNLINWLAAESSVPVHLAEDNTKALPGHAYFAPSDTHLTFAFHHEDGFHMMLNHDEPINYLRPAVDKMFGSAAKVIGPDCIAVVLTGMGTDGARECLNLKKLGVYTITQDEASSVIYGMPKAAYEMGGSCEVLPLNQIPERLWNLSGRDKI